VKRNRRRPGLAPTAKRPRDEIARTTGGEVNATPDRIKPAPTPEGKEPLAPVLLPVAMAIFLLELIVRRLRAG